MKLRDSLFIADLHLDEQADARLEHALAVVNRAGDLGLDLFILGDLFETWVGDDGASDAQRRFIQALKAHASRRRLYIQHGNRDFLLGERFLAESGATLLNETHLCQLTDGRRVLLAHGDQWCTDDTAYQALRQQVRDPAWQRAMLAQPLEQRRALARQARQQSMQHQQNSMETLLDVNAQAVEQAFRQHEADLIIHGHTHRPAVHRQEIGGRTRERWVLGDWHPNGQIILLRDGKLQALDSQAFAQA